MFFLRLCFSQSQSHWICDLFRSPYMHRCFFLVRSGCRGRVRAVRVVMHGFCFYDACSCVCFSSGTGPVVRCVFVSVGLSPSLSARCGDVDAISWSSPKWGALIKFNSIFLSSTVRETYGWFFSDFVVCFLLELCREKK